VARFDLAYIPFEQAPSVAFPTRVHMHRPILALNLVNGESSFGCYAIVDSGADDCIFPASFAEQLGLNYTDGRHYPFGGAGDGVQAAYFFDILLDIQHIAQYPVAIGFTLALEHFGCGLLGQTGFFDRFKLEFDCANKKFALSTPG
jgi:hypothetical protein